MVYFILIIILVHYIFGALILLIIDFKAEDVNTLKIWKAGMIGGLGMLAHYLINTIIKKGSRANFNWTIKEWLLK